MNDEQLKNLLNKDMSTPEAPINEWSKIESKMNRNRFAFTFPLILSASLMVIVALNLQPLLKKSPLDMSNDEDIVEYMLDDSYYESSENLYGWVEQVY